MVGPKHISFWDVKGNAKKGKFGSVDKMTNFTCVAYDNSGQVYSGGQNGQIYKWQKSALEKMIPMHKGVIHCLRFLSDPKTTRKCY